MRSANVISDSIKSLGEIEVLFKGDKIDNLTVTKVAFWNSGNDTINDTDLAPTDKLRIELCEGFIVLDSEVLFQSEMTNNVQTHLTPTCIEIKFDYMDGNQGGIIKFIHTGKKSSDVLLKGTFKGCEKIKKVNSNFNTVRIILIEMLPLIGEKITKKKGNGMRILSKLLPWTFLFIGISTSCTSFIMEINEPLKSLSLVFGILYMLIGLLFFVGSSMPKGFEMFFDDE